MMSGRPGLEFIPETSYEVLWTTSILLGKFCDFLFKYAATDPFYFFV